MTVAGWLLTIEPGRGEAIRAALSVRPGVDCRGEDRKGYLVVVSESNGRGDALPEIERSFAAVSGVRDVSLVAAFDEEAAAH
jgi:nitrate reductase NapAB chaperone NapD